MFSMQMMHCSVDSFTGLLACSFCDLMVAMRCCSRTFDRPASSSISCATLSHVTCRNGIAEREQGGPSCNNSIFFASLVVCTYSEIYLLDFLRPVAHLRSPRLPPLCRVRWSRGRSPGHSRGRLPTVRVGRRHVWWRRFGGEVDEVTEILGVGPRCIFSIRAGKCGGRGPEILRAQSRGAWRYSRGSWATRGRRRRRGWMRWGRWSAGRVGRFTNRALYTFQSQYACSSTSRSAEELEMTLKAVGSRIIFEDPQFQIGRVCFGACIPLEEGNWVGQDVNGFGSRMWWTAGVELTKMRTW